MAVKVTDPLMAAHTWTVELDHSAGVLERLTEVVAGQRQPRELYARFLDANGNQVYPTMILLSVEGDEEGLTIGGQGPYWHLGLPGGPGAFIRDLEFVSGRDRLDNGDFTDDLRLLYWKTRQDTGWEWNPAYHDIAYGIGSAYMGGLPDKDDVMESREYPCDPGQQWFFFGFFIRGPGSLGRIRLRTIYHGRFTPPNLAQPYSTWGPSVRSDIDLMTDPSGIVTGPVFRLQSQMPNLIPDFEFDGGVPSADWDDLSCVWGPGTDGGWNGTNYAFTDVDPGCGIAVLKSNLPLGIVAGEGYEMRIVIRANPGSPATDGEAWMEVALTATGIPPYDRVTTRAARGPMPTTDWNIFTERFTIPDNIPTGSMTPLLYRVGGTAGRWDYDTPTLFRFKGNLDQVIGPVVGGIPERTYKWTVPYRVDPGVSSGRAQMRAALYGDGRPVIHVDGPELKGMNDTNPLQHASFDVTLPSGYDAWEPRLISEDIIGGAVWVGEGTILDTDTGTYVVDELTGHLQSTWLLRQRVTTAPAGTETVSFAVVAEQYGIGWLADTLRAVRTGVPLATHTDVVEALLTNQTTGAALPIAVGTVIDPGVIPMDWRVLLTFNRDAWAHFNSAIASPGGEWRINIDGTLDWAPYGSLFVDHHPDSSSPVVLVQRDLDVKDIGGVEADVEARATDILVLGADVPTGGGRSMLITATAVVAGTSGLAQRTKVISDATIDSRLYAQAVADDEAERQALPPLSVTATLNEIDPADAATLGIPARPDFATGDTIYVYHPEALLEDRTVETEVAGETVWPRPMRVQEKAREHSGPGWRIQMVEPDGSVWDLPDVIWSDEDSTTLTLGDRRPPEIGIDSAGQAEGVQYLRDRAGRPR